MQPGARDERHAHKANTTYCDFSSLPPPLVNVQLVSCLAWKMMFKAQRGQCEKVNVEGGRKGERTEKPDAPKDGSFGAGQTPTILGPGRGGGEDNRASDAGVSLCIYREAPGGRTESVPRGGGGFLGKTRGQRADSQLRTCCSHRTACVLWPCSGKRGSRVLKSCVMGEGGRNRESAQRPSFESPLQEERGLQASLHNPVRGSP